MKNRVRHYESPLQEKTKIDKFFIFMMIFAFLLATGVVLGVDYEELTLFEKIIITFPGIFILSVGLCLGCFFRKQVVNIKVQENGLLFIKNNGKSYKIIENCIEVQNLQNTYVFYFSGKKAMTAYKYMPFEPFAHKKKMDHLVEALIKKGYIAVKKY